MRRTSLPIAALAITLLGCRPPAIPENPSPHEYAVYSTWLEQTSSTLPPSLTFAVDAQTLTPRQNDLQFKQCLPPRMGDVFDDVPSAILTSTSGNEWLKLSDSRPAYLRPPNTPLSFDRPTEWIRLSRAAFTMSGYDAYLWIEHRTCGAKGKGCEEGSGILLHGTKSSGVWSFEDTMCQIIIPPIPAEP